MSLQENIWEAVQWLVRDSQGQDSLVFAFSGHGCMDVSHNQERDGILPSDYEKVPAFRHPPPGNPISSLMWDACFHLQIPEHVAE